MRRIVVRVAWLLALTGCAGLTVGDRPAARAELRDATGRAVGTARLEQVGDGVHLVLALTGLPPGVHAVHLHEVGRCDPPDFASAGGHASFGSALTRSRTTPAHAAPEQCAKRSRPHGDFMLNQ